MTESVITPLSVVMTGKPDPIASTITHGPSGSIGVNKYIRIVIILNLFHDLLHVQKLQVGYFSHFLDINLVFFYLSTFPTVNLILRFKSFNIFIESIKLIMPLMAGGLKI